MTHQEKKEARIEKYRNRADNLFSLASPIKRSGNFSKVQDSGGRLLRVHGSDT